MTDLADLEQIPPIQVFEGVRVRRVQGDLVTLAVVELDPNAVVPEHRHPNEQHGMVITGQMDFRIGDERRTLGPGGTWRIVPMSLTRHTPDPTEPWWLTSSRRSGPIGTPSPSSTMLSRSGLRNQGPRSR